MCCVEILAGSEKAEHTCKTTRAGKNGQWPFPTWWRRIWPECKQDVLRTMFVTGNFTKNGSSQKSTQHRLNAVRRREIITELFEPGLPLALSDIVISRSIFLTIFAKSVISYCCLVRKLLSILTFFHEISISLPLRNSQVSRRELTVFCTSKTRLQMKRASKTQLSSTHVSTTESLKNWVWPYLYDVVNLSEIWDTTKQYVSQTDDTLHNQTMRFVFFCNTFLC